jgi:hypothetical protein
LRLHLAGKIARLSAKPSSSLTMSSRRCWEDRPPWRNRCTHFATLLYDELASGAASDFERVCGNTILLRALRMNNVFNKVAGSVFSRWSGRRWPRSIHMILEINVARHG